MSYFVNQSVFSNLFSLPTAIADKHLKLATSIQLKVIIYIFRDISKGVNPQDISSALSVDVSEVEDALVFWEQCGVLGSEKEVEKAEEPLKSIVKSAEMPTRADVIKRGMEDERLMFLLREAQLKFGRNLKQNESALLVSLYDDNGMDASVILLLLQYAASVNKCNISFIRSTAVKWLKAGVESVLDAEKIISQTAKSELAWRKIENIFGIEHRKPSERELELSHLWINEWGLSDAILKAGYDACVDNKTRLDMRYVAKIFENWHKSGFKKPEDIKAEPKNTQKTKKATDKGSYAGYDLDLFEKMLNED